MEVDFIFLSKETKNIVLNLSIKRRIVEILKKLFMTVSDSDFQLEVDGYIFKVQYQLSSKATNMVFAKMTCNEAQMKAAKILNYAVNRLLQGEYRKEFNIILSYDEVSQVYCCKAMPLFGIFERRTRELVYLTIVKIFGIEWYDRSFNKELQNELSGKVRKNRSKLIEGALNELTYEQLKNYLFEPFSNLKITDVMNKQLASTALEEMTKEEIVDIIEKCRNISLWDRFFSKYPQFHDFKDRLEKLQPKRNVVMHHKRLKLEEYELLRRDLKYINRKLEEAISLLEEEIYTENNLTEVVSALGKMLKDVLGSTVTKWSEQIKPMLQSFGKMAIVAAMPKIDIPKLIPDIQWGSLAQQIGKIRNVQQSILKYIPDYTYVSKITEICNSSGLQAMPQVSQIATSQLNAVLQLNDGINLPKESGEGSIDEKNEEMNCSKDEKRPE